MDDDDDEDPVERFKDSTDWDAPLWLGEAVEDDPEGEQLRYILGTRG